MPELPEVEVTRRRIAPLLVGRRIATVATTSPSYVFLTPPGRLRSVLPGLRVEGLERLGKYLRLRLEDESTLVIHLGMTGQLFSSRATSPRLLSASARASLDPESQGNVVCWGNNGNEKASPPPGNFQFLSGTTNRTCGGSCSASSPSTE